MNPKLYYTGDRLLYLENAPRYSDFDECAYGLYREYDKAFQIAVDNGIMVEQDNQWFSLLRKPLDIIRLYEIPKGYEVIFEERIGTAGQSYAVALLRLNYKERYEKIAKADWFKKAYEGKSLEDSSPVSPEIMNAVIELINAQLKLYNLMNPDFPISIQDVVNHLNRAK